MVILLSVGSFHFTCCPMRAIVVITQWRFINRYYHIVSIVWPCGEQYFLSFSLFLSLSPWSLSHSFSMLLYVRAKRRDIAGRYMNARQANHHSLAHCTDLCRIIRRGTFIMVPLVFFPTSSCEYREQVALH